MFMGKLSSTGRIFFGVAIAAMGLLAIYYKDFPYMLVPPDHSNIPGIIILTYISGALLVVAGVCIVFVIKIRPVAVVLGSVLLMVFCFYYVPYELIVSKNYMHFGEWENSEKELALAAGAFVVAGCFSGNNENALTRLLSRLIPAGAIVFSLTMICFGISHFLYIQGVLEYMPLWVTHRMFWGYLAGVGLIGSGVAIILNIQRRSSAFLLGTMIFTWFVILHIPKVVVAAPADLEGEIPSAFLALAYSGIAFVIAGRRER